MTSVLTCAECPKGRVFSLPSSMWDRDHCTVNSWGLSFWPVWVSIRVLLAVASTSTPQRNLCGRQHWSGHCLFRESQGVSQTFFHASFFSFTPSPFLEALFSSPLLFLSVAPTERTETDTPPSQRFVCQYGQPQSGTKAHWRCPHTATPPTHPPPKKQIHNRLPHSPQTPLHSVIFYLLRLLMTKHLLQRSLFVFLFFTVGTLQALAASNSRSSLPRLCVHT